MAIAEKTVQYSFQTNPNVIPDQTLGNLSQITVEIPEANPTFTSAFLEVSWHDVITVTGGTITEHRVYFRLGGATYTAFIETDDLANTAENMAFVIGPIDMTNHFTTNWTGTSMTADVQVLVDHSTGTTLGVRNVNAILKISYQYDDTETTQLKTVRIPFDIKGTSLSTTVNDVYSAIPQLTGVGGLFPEDSVSIKDYFFVIEGNSGNTSTTDFSISTSIDSNAGAQLNFGTIEAALASGCFYRFVDKRSGAGIPDPTTTHDFNMWSALGNPNLFGTLAVELVVTYTFNASTSTRILNSISIPIEIASPLGQTVEARASRFQRDIIISEPGTINLRQSAFRINCSTPLSMLTRWRAGSQTYKDNQLRGSVMCGMHCLQQRIDADGSQGAGMTLVRGKNTITIDGYGTATATLTNLNGFILLNYESDKASGGIGKHNKSVDRILREWNAQLLTLTTITNGSFPIIEPNYWLSSIGMCLYQHLASASMAITLDTQVLSGETKGAGYLDIYADAYQSDAERGTSITWARGRDVFKRCPQDGDINRLDVESPRNYRFFCTTNLGSGAVVQATYHSHTWNVAGNILNNNALLPTEVRLVNASSLEAEQVVTLAAGVTAFNFTVYNDVIEYFVEAFQDNTKVGRSGNGVGV